jgi:hypothetical protein
VTAERAALRDMATQIVCAQQLTLPGPVSECKLGEGSYSSVFRALFQEKQVGGLA